MPENRVLVLIPARMAATRLPGSGRTVLLAAGSIATVAYFATTAGLIEWLGPGGTERAVIYSLLIGLLVAGLRGAAAQVLRRRPGLRLRLLARRFLQRRLADLG